VSIARFRVTPLAAALGFATLLQPLDEAHAELLVSQLVVELSPGEHRRSDVEIVNSGPEQVFVSVEPREIIAAGTSAESARTDPDPEKLGLLVSPARMVLEAGQRRLLRIASIESSSRERIYRVTVKPVVGQLQSEASGLKVLVGYDMLVIVRPPELKPHVSAARSGERLILTNDGNVSVELEGGKACDAAMKICKDLPGGRLYTGAQKAIRIAADRRVSYELKVGSKIVPIQF
jgi:P pilus assembly chaperone PapD